MHRWVQNLRTAAGMGNWRRCQLELAHCSRPGPVTARGCSAPSSPTGSLDADLVNCVAPQHQADCGLHKLKESHGRQHCGCAEIETPIPAEAEADLRALVLATGRGKLAGLGK